MMNSIQTLLTMRQRMRLFAEGLGEEQLMAIPMGFKNNIAWNLGHLVLVQQQLCYKLSKLPMPIDAHYVGFFGKDSSPGDWDTPPDMQDFLPQLSVLAERFAKDYEQGLFKEFGSYTTGFKLKLDSLDQALRFNLMHEGIHWGYAMAQLRALS